MKSIPDNATLAEHARPDVPLAPLTWFGLGGSARWFAEPRSVDSLAEVVRICRDHALPLHMLGSGANLLIADDGVDGMVVRLNAPAFKKISLPTPEIDGACDSAVRHSPPAAGEEVLVTAAGGTDMSRLVLDAVRAGLTGLECMGGIPGTLGGIIRMNAGGRYGQIADVVREVTVVDREGRVRTLSCSEVGFSYRHTDLDGAVVVSATLALRRDDPVRLRQRYLEIWNFKKQSQPLGDHSAGCVFKNPPNARAGELIDRAGLKGRTIGGAAVSTVHANFIVAKEGATADDVLALIGIIRREVAQRFGVELQTEIEVWGRRVPRGAEASA
jgi:UDP-N-acetylmuramate dehydrogenase